MIDMAIQEYLLECVIQLWIANSDIGFFVLIFALD